MKSLMSPAPGAAFPGPLAAFSRFVAVGGGTGVLSSLAVPLLAMLMPWLLSNALITIASTVLGTELHARYTFHTGRRAGWRRHWQSAGSAAAAYAATSVAVFTLHALQSSPSALTGQIVYLSASGLAGVGRFLTLRLFIFATGRDQRTKPANTTQTDNSPIAMPSSAHCQRRPRSAHDKAFPTTDRLRSWPQPACIGANTLAFAESPDTGGLQLTVCGR